MVAWSDDTGKLFVCLGDGVVCGGGVTWSNNTMIRYRGTLCKYSHKN